MNLNVLNKLNKCNKWVPEYHCKDTPIKFSGLIPHLALFDKRNSLHARFTAWSQSLRSMCECATNARYYDFYGNKCGICTGWLGYIIPSDVKSSDLFSDRCEKRYKDWRECGNALAPILNVGASAKIDTTYNMQHTNGSEMPSNCDAIRMDYIIR